MMNQVENLPFFENVSEDQRADSLQHARMELVKCQSMIQEACSQLTRATGIVASLSRSLNQTASQDSLQDDATGPSAEEIRDQLQRILDSKEFVQSVRLRRFLRYTVDRTLAGESESLKEYTVGRDVFDRGEDYDQRLDSIVRVEARRLRKKLDEYYRGAGGFDPVAICYLPGHYAPVFSRRFDGSHN